MIDESLNTWKDMDLILIEKAYNKTREHVLFEPINKATFLIIKNLMQSQLPNYKVKCDEENNPPQFANGGNILLTVNDPKSNQYVNVIF